MTKELFDEIISTINKMSWFETQEDEGGIELCTCNTEGCYPHYTARLQLHKGIVEAAKMCDVPMTITPPDDTREFYSYSFTYKGVRVFELVAEGEEP